VNHAAPARFSLGLELIVVSILGWMALLAIPLALGYMGISWDALNHHIYLGWTAERPRFDHDQLAASFQSFQFPYLYWPVFKLAQSGASGVTAGIVLASLHACAIPAVWLVAHSCIQGRSLTDVAMRACAVVLGFSSIVVLSMFDSTSNDLLATIPLLWSLAVALRPIGADGNERRTTGLVVLSGYLAGLSVAFKLSNGPLAILAPIVWFLCARQWQRRFVLVFVGALSAAVGFLLTYGYWGWQLWVHVGNPVYPFADAYFEPLRRWMEWHP
jgi:hypothetical protein